MQKDKHLPIGSQVQVGPRYMGSGVSIIDGDTGGPYTIVGILPGYGGTDYKLVRGNRPDARSADWTVIVHESRIVPL